MRSIWVLAGAACLGFLTGPCGAAAVQALSPVPAEAVPLLLAHGCHRSIQYGEVAEWGEELWHFHDTECGPLRASEQKPPPTAGGPGEPPPPAPPGIRPQMKIDPKALKAAPRS
ncbi:hypothetical protein [Afifella sp. IM 167]|uniref:hypothetical protein n=1 Tax=Afifella sp. IM 167 TaxID=2033586 RepID=UPI001CD011EF|nr:hypothetical protein [Afifella sp. IM 167]MBZ8134920.1 hypothetical protein [Afifella sp. IM 167]